MVLTLLPACPQCNDDRYYRLPDPAGRGDLVPCEKCAPEPKITARNDRINKIGFGARNLRMGKGPIVDGTATEDVQLSTCVPPERYRDEVGLLHWVTEIDSGIVDDRMAFWMPPRVAAPHGAWLLPSGTTVYLWMKRARNWTYRGPVPTRDQFTALLDAATAAGRLADELATDAQLSDEENAFGVTTTRVEVKALDAALEPFKISAGKAVGHPCPSCICGNPWLPIKDAPTDGTKVRLWVPEKHGLPAFICEATYHPDGGWCVCELRHATHFQYLDRPCNRLQK